LAATRVLMNADPAALAAVLGLGRSPGHPGRFDVVIVARTRLPYESAVDGLFAAGDVRAGSMKRVAAAVGEGSSVIQSVHQHLTRFWDVDPGDNDGQWNQGTR
jgi:hypothetical protein